jgi:hypothetical protein
MNTITNFSTQPIHTREELLAQYIIEAVNSMGFEDKKCAGLLVTTHRTLQQNIMRLFVAFVNEMAGRKYDARNEASVTLSKKIVEMMSKENLDYLPYI